MPGGISGEMGGNKREVCGGGYSIRRKSGVVFTIQEDKVTVIYGIKNYFSPPPGLVASSLRVPCHVVGIKVAHHNGITVRPEYVGQGGTSETVVLWTATGGGNVDVI